MNTAKGLYPGGIFSETFFEAVEEEKGRGIIGNAETGEEELLVKEPNFLGFFFGFGGGEEGGGGLSEVEGSRDCS